MSTTPELPPLLLVVDDNPLNVEPLSDLLESMGYRVAQALDGQTALQVAREQTPDLILLDIMMPGMNGFEVCTHLKADPQTVRIPVVFVTALSDTDDKVRAIEVGGDDFLTKPFNRPILLARIRSLLRLKAANDQLEDSYRKLKALKRIRDDLMKMIVHDLKSPLAGVLATLEMVVDGDLGPLADQQRRLLEDAQRQGDQMLTLIDDLLELTRLEETEMVLNLTRVDMARLLDEVVAEWRVRVEREAATLEADHVPGLTLQADEHLLRRVFSNLIGNALRHAGPGIRIRLSARPAEGGAGVHFVVEDNGVGISEAAQEVVFEKFETVGEAGSASSGLGLAFCKLAVEAHGGRIWVESREGAGSAFHLVLPPEPPQAAATSG